MDSDKLAQWFENRRRQRRYAENMEQNSVRARQPWYVSHAETIAQNVVGQILAFIILWAYGIPGSTGWKLQLTFLVVAYARGYTIRRFFNRLKSH